MTSEGAIQAWITRRAKRVQSKKRGRPRITCNPHASATNKYYRFATTVRTHGHPPINDFVGWGAWINAGKLSMRALLPKCKIRSCKKYCRSYRWTDEHPQAFGSIDRSRVSAPINYDRPRKNAFRNRIIDSFKDIRGTCLALESPQFLFAKGLPKLNFVIFENNQDQYAQMNLHHPDNIRGIFYSDVGNAALIEEEFSCAFIDFCKTFPTCKDELIKLKKKLAGCQKIALTFGIRSGKKAWWEGDYQYAFQKELRFIFPDHVIDYGDGYRDGTQMVGFILSKIERPTEGANKQPEQLNTMEQSKELLCAMKLLSNFKECARSSKLRGCGQLSERVSRRFRIRRREAGDILDALKIR